jgi:hypothetical protein
MDPQCVIGISCQFPNSPNYIRGIMSSTLNSATAKVRIIHISTIFFIFSLLMNSAGCSHPTEGNSHVPLINYSWTVDTLPYNRASNIHTVTSIWGVNDSLVYATGTDGFVWKFNGKVWVQEKIFTNEGGTIAPPLNLYAVTGTAANDIYAFGETITNQNGAFESLPYGIHYDGVQWRQITFPQGGGGIRSAFVLNSTTIYCAGLNGALFQMNGGIWTLDTIARSSIKSSWFTMKIYGVTPNNGIYLSFLQYGDSAVYFKLLRYANKTTTLIDSAKNNPSWGGIDYWQSPAGVQYSTGPKGIYRLSVGFWSNFFVGDQIDCIMGVNDEHIFAAGYQGIYFSNDGYAWDLVWHTSNDRTPPSAIWCTQDEVFIAYDLSPNEYIVHGKKQ